MASTWQVDFLYIYSDPCECKTMWTLFYFVWLLSWDWHSSPLALWCFWGGLFMVYQWVGYVSGVLLQQLSSSSWLFIIKKIFVFLSYFILLIFLFYLMICIVYTYHQLMFLSAIFLNAYFYLFLYINELRLHQLTFPILKKYKLLVYLYFYICKPSHRNTNWVAASCPKSSRNVVRRLPTSL